MLARELAFAVLCATVSDSQVDIESAGELSDKRSKATDQQPCEPFQLNLSMRQFITYILLYTVVAAQLFGSSATTTLECAEKGCQCSVQLQTQGACCCSASAADTSSCCAPVQASCCSGREHDRTNAPSICRCGCQQPSTPAPAKTESPNSKLRQLLCTSLAPTLHSIVLDRALFDANQQSTSFFSGPSAQSLYCCWLI